MLRAALPGESGGAWALGRLGPGLVGSLETYKVRVSGRIPSSWNLVVVNLTVGLPVLAVEAVLLGGLDCPQLLLLGTRLLLVRRGDATLWGWSPVSPVSSTPLLPWGPPHDLDI